MSAISAAALVQPVRNPYFQELERRDAERRSCDMEATSHPIEVGETLSWGAVVHDISAGGLGVTLCFPFRPGTYLAVDLRHPSGASRTLMVRVLHVNDQSDGQWRLGCEFIKPLTPSELEMLL